jgi:hypothetical protein
MSTGMTVGDVLARLEKQVAYHREQEERWGREEARCRELRERHAGEAEAAERSLAAFREISGPAVERASARLPVEKEDPGLELGPRPRLSRLVDLVVRTIEPTEPFGRSRVLRELERRFGSTFRKKPQPRHVSLVLQRMADAQRLYQIRAGRPHWEALYVREKPAAEG